MKIRGVDYIFYNVTDLKKSLYFYQNVLGLKLGKPANDTWAELETGNMTLAIGVFGASGSQAAKDAVSVALAVDDMDKALAELKQKGVPVIQDKMDFDPCAMAIITDPDGNQIILHRRKDGTVG